VLEDHLRAPPRLKKERLRREAGEDPSLTECLWLKLLG